VSRTTISLCISMLLLIFIPEIMVEWGDTIEETGEGTMGYTVASVILLFLMFILPIVLAIKETRR